MIAANKQDLQHRSVSEEEAQEFAASQGAAYFQTSAKTGLGLELLFSTLVSSVLDSLKDERQSAGQGGFNSTFPIMYSFFFGNMFNFSSETCCVQ